MLLCLWVQDQHSWELWRSQQWTAGARQPGSQRQEKCFCCLVQEDPCRRGGRISEAYEGEKRGDGMVWVVDRGQGERDRDRGRRKKAIKVKGGVEEGGKDGEAPLPHLILLLHLRGECGEDEKKTTHSQKDWMSDWLTPRRTERQTTRVLNLLHLLFSFRHHVTILRYSLWSCDTSALHTVDGYCE